MNKFDSSMPRAPRRRRLAALAVALGVVVAVSAVATPASAAPRVSTLTVGAQSGALTSGTAGSATFLVTVTNGSILPVTANLSVSGLPAGATGSFSPSSVSWGLFTPVGTTRTSTLTVTTTAATAAAATAFTVTAARNTNAGDNASGGGTLTVAAGGQQSQTITFAPLSDRTFGDADFNVGATSTSGLPVNFSATGDCTVTGSLVHLTGAGSCTVTASQPGGGGYLPAPDVPRTFAIAQASQTIDFPAIGSMLTSGSFTPAATATSGLAVSFAASGSCSLVGGVVELAATPGSCTVTASQPGDANYAAAPDVARTFDVVAPGGAGQIDLYAVAGSTTLAGATGPITVYGYSLDGSAVDRPGGPVLDVTEGDEVTIVLHNQLDEPTSLVVRGQSMVSDTSGAPPGGSVVYSFTAGDAGTVIYEAGPLDGAQYQSAMGLYGAMRVLPQSGATPDAVVLVSELDPALNGAADPAAFDMRSYAPKYELINGSTYADTAQLASVDAGGSLLLRYVNAGTNYHSMAVLGAEQRIVADDGHPLDEPYTVVAQTVGPGQTVDAAVDVSDQAVIGTRLAVYDAALQLNGPGRRPATATASVSYGGALGFLEVTGTAAGGPLAIDLDVGASAITATIDDSRTGGQNIQAAEYHIDTLGGAGTAMSATGTFDSPVEGVTAPRPASLSDGSLHTVYVRGQDALGNWGPYSSYVVSAVVGPDATGPVVSAIAMAPNPTNGTSAVTLQASASDATTGGSNVTAAEYTIDGGTAVALTVSPTAVTASLDGTIPAGVVASLSNGTHPIEVRAQDSVGNWGDPVSANLVIDTNAPTVSGVTATPNPSNGVVGVNPGTPAVRISATANDATSALSAAEGFLDTVGTNGTGFVFAPTDATWDSSTEAIVSDIPLATILTLADGNHTVYVHAKDAAGNWGATSSVVLVVDKSVPTATIALAGPSPTSAASVAFTVTFSESVTGGSAADFTLVQAGGLSGSTISSVTGSGTTRTVTVTVGSGSGTLGLNLNASSSFSDAAGNAPAAVTGPQYTIQSGAAPTVAGITPASTNPAGVTNLAFTVTFSQPVTGGSAANFTLATSGITGASITSVTGTGSTRTVTVNTGIGAGTLRLDLTSSAGITGSGGGLTGLPFAGTTWSVPSPGYFSTGGNTNPPGLGGTADDADVYLWNPGVSPRAFNRSIDVTAMTNPLPAGANVDAIEWINATHFLVSFADAVAVPGAGTVQDEDIVYYNNGTWSLVFDGSVNGIATTDVDAISLVGATLYFSTDNNDSLPGVTGPAGDDADIYRWNGGASFTRIVDASAVGWSTENVDGLTFIDATHMYLSYGVDTTVPGLGAVADEDVVYLNGATWSMYFDGSIVGLTDPNLNLDAFDLP